MKNEIKNPMERFISKEETYFYGDGGVSDCDDCCNDETTRPEQTASKFICDECKQLITNSTPFITEDGKRLCVTCYAAYGGEEPSDGTIPPKEDENTNTDDGSYGDGGTRFKCAECGEYCPCNVRCIDKDGREVCMFCFRNPPVPEQTTKKFICDGCKKPIFNESPNPTGDGREFCARCYAAWVNGETVPPEENPDDNPNEDTNENPNENPEENPDIPVTPEVPEENPEEDPEENPDIPVTPEVPDVPVQDTSFVCKECKMTCPCGNRAYDTDFCYICYNRLSACLVCGDRVASADRFYGKTDLCKTCGNALTVTVSPAECEVKVGKTVKLTATLSEEIELPITWSTTDTDKISVSDDGTVTALSPGTATVTASIAEFGINSAPCVIEVVKVPDSYDVVTGKEPVYLDETPPSEATTSISKDALVQDPVDAYSGAHILTNTVFTLRGGQNLKVKLDYRSNRFGKGELGAGWNHNFEKRLEINGNYAYLYEGESVYLKFERECETCSLFNCTTTGRKTYTLEEIDGVYCLNRNFDVLEYYVDGKLTRIVTRQGFETVLSHTPTLTTITDCISGKKVYLEKNADGRIVKIYDDAARSAIIDYHGDLLVRIIDANGKSLVYDYDSSGRVKSGYDADDTCYFENTYDGDGRVVSQQDALGNPISTFVYETNGSRVTTNRNGDCSVRVFDSVGQLKSYTDENGITKTYSYDDNGNLISETDGNGNSISYTFNEFNKISRAVDKNGNATVYEYDIRGNMTRVVYPAVNGVSPSETYEYNASNHLVRHVDLRGTVTTYSYDENGLPVSMAVGTKSPMLCAYENGLKISETDAKGNTSFFEYDAAGFMTCKTDAKGAKTYYSYDKAGNPVEITDAEGNKTYLEYDSNYKPLSETDANGNKTSFIYNGNLKLTKTTYADGSTEQYEYDGEDRPVKFTDRAGKITVTAYDKGGRVVSKTMPDGGVVRYEYDNAGRVTKETNPKGAVTTMTYDKNGNVLTVKDNAGNVTTNTYDALNRLVKKTNAANNSITYTYNAAGDLIAETDALGKSVTYTYDAYGNKLTAKDRNGNTVTYTYDANNNLLTETDPLGNVKTFTYDERNLVVSAKDAMNCITTYGYDVLGRRTTVTDARNNTFTNTYDAMNNVLKVIDAKGNTVSETVYNDLNLPETVTDATGNTNTYVYNSLGKVASVTNSRNKVKTFAYDSMGRNNSVTDEMNGVSSVTYDKLGNVTKLQGPLGGATNYTYDTMGRLTAESTTSSGTVRYTYNELNLKKTLTNARGSKRTYTYDANGRVKSYTDSGKTVSFTYDNNGNVLTVTDSNGTITRTFDALNRVTSCTDTAGNTIGYTYNAVGDLVKITYPDNSAVNYTYDANHNLITVTDWANRVTTYTYDVNNNVVGVTKPDGSVTTTVYDNMQRVTSHVERTASGTVITGFEYTYDELGRISEEKDIAKNVKICYTYDELSRVIKANTVDLTTNAQSIEDFSYDAAGNIISGDADSAFEYDANNRLTSFNGNAVLCDMDGNMINDPATGDIYSYDFAKRLVSTSENTYTYNAEDTRIAAVYNGITTVYTYNTNAKLSQLLVKETNGVTTKYVYGLGLIGEEVSGTFKTYHYDYRGSTVAITNVNGTVIDTFSYDTYGKLTNRTGNSDIIFLYNGRDGVITEPNGLLYMRARYYSPTLYRFINSDIIPGQISNSVTLNRYAYANGNPVSNVDPFGLSAERRNNNEDFLELSLNDIDLLSSVKDSITALFLSSWHDLTWPGEVHREVQEYISNNVLIGAELEHPVLGGRIDIAYEIGGVYECYEVKPVSYNNFEKRLLAQAQLNYYVNAGKVAGGNYETGTYIFPVTQVPHDKYDIYYWGIGDGIILYKFSRKKEEQNQEHSVKEPKTESNKSVNPFLLIPGLNDKKNKGFCPEPVPIGNPVAADSFGNSILGDGLHDLPKEAKIMILMASLAAAAGAGIMGATKKKLE